MVSSVLSFCHEVPKPHLYGRASFDTPTDTTKTDTTSGHELVASAADFLDPLRTHGDSRYAYHTDGGGHAEACPLCGWADEKLRHREACSRIAIDQGLQHTFGHVLPVAALDSNPPYAPWQSRGRTFVSRAHELQLVRARHAGAELSAGTAFAHLATSRARFRHTGCHRKGRHMSHRACDISESCEAIAETHA